MSGSFLSRGVTGFRDAPEHYFWPILLFLFQLGGAVVFIPVLIGISLLPLSGMLLLIPALLPDESVLTESAKRGFFARLLFRLTAVVLGLGTLVGIIGCAVYLTGTITPELLNDLGERGQAYTAASAKVAANPQLDASTIPESSVSYVLEPLNRAWFTRALFAGLLIYSVDVLILALIGRVPLTYNLRNMLVRWPTTLMTALAPAVIVALLTAMLAFINGMNELTDSSGIPGNVICMSEGALDEIFSNLGYNDIGLVERLTVRLDPKDQPLPTPVRIARVPPEIADPSQGEQFLASRETYAIASQALATVPGQQAKRRFVQVRGVVDPLISAAVHNLPLKEGRWFRDAGVSADGRVEAVIGEGVAETLGKDQGKPLLKLGDGFTLNDRDWVVVGIIKAEGTTFGSEVWAKQSIVGSLFSKAAYTTVVLRCEPATVEAAQALAYDLRNRFTQIKLRAVTEQEYFSKLGETNKQFLIAILFVAAVMAVGGIFGIMNTMFAAIAQRTKDLGVLRLLGFKRWQVLVSILLESLAIALLGGIIGCLLGSIVHGWSATSIISSGQGGGKTVILRLIVDLPTILAGLTFTVTMGRLGGLVPALSAMRLRILESLR